MATSSKRLNIYINDPNIRRQIKALAAQKDISMSEYCLRAISKQLIEELGEKRSNPLKSAIKKAKTFQKKIFKGKVFAISSADLIRESRESRNKQQ